MGSSEAQTRRLRAYLDHPVPDSLAPELAKRIFYISSAIDEFEMVSSNGVVNALDLVVNGSEHADFSAISRRINRVISTEVLPQRVFTAKVLWQSPELATNPTDPYSALVEGGVAFPLGEGQVGFGEPLVSLLDYLDRRVRRIALSLPAAREYQYPTLLPVRVLEKFNYLTSFPQHAMFVTRLHNDMDSYADFVKNYKATGKAPADIFRYCRNQDYCLPPTMCYHCYQQYEGRQLPHHIVVTAKGKSFRYESKYERGLERLWDFTIREIVFMGDSDFVASCRAEVMRQVYSLIAELELGGRCAVANDPFFADTETVERIFSQRLREAKCELLLPVTPNREIAVASFNLHGHFFSTAFNISHANDGPVATGCVGVGLERFAYAFVSQHGVNQASWPATVRRGVA